MMPSKQTGYATKCQVHSLLLNFYLNQCLVSRLYRNVSRVYTLHLLVLGLPHPCPTLTLTVWFRYTPSACCHLFCPLHHTGSQKKLLNVVYDESLIVYKL